MIHYIIDGNNLIGKVGRLKAMQPQAARETLASRVDGYFMGRRCRVTLHFDGYANLAIPTSKVKIVYSESQKADQKIKLEIEASKNPRLIRLVSSDHNLIEFARVCRCSYQTSESMAEELYSRASEDEEQRIIRSMSSEEFRRLFGED